MVDLQTACKVTKYFSCMQQKYTKILLFICANDCKNSKSKCKNYFLHIYKENLHIYKKSSTFAAYFMNTLGNRFSFTSFGESHGRAIGGVLDGVPAGLQIVM